MTEDHGRAASPIFVVNPSAVFPRERAHSFTVTVLGTSALSQTTKAKRTRRRKNRIRYGRTCCRKNTAAITRRPRETDALPSIRRLTASFHAFLCALRAFVVH